MSKKLVLSLGLMLCLGLALPACSKQEEKPKEEPKQEQAADQKQEEKKEDKKTVAISDWEGTWNNMGAYLDNKDVQKGFDILAKNEKKSVDEVKATYKKKRSCEFNGFKVEGNKVIFLDNFADKGGKEIASAEYEFVEKHMVKHGNHELEWDAFKAKDPNAKYPVLLMMPVHGEEALTHFHMRYGKDVKELLAMDDWYPTFVKPSTTADQLVEEISE